MSKTQRLLELMELVKQKRIFTVKELADEFQVSYRTMWRYLQELSTYGIALYSEPGSHGGYRILDSNQGIHKIEAVYKTRSTYIGYSFDAPYIAKAETEILAPRLWLKLLSQVKELRGIQHPLKKTALSYFRNENFTYFIAVEADINKTIKDIPQEMTAISIPEMYYVRKTHLSNLDLNQVIDTYEDIYRWISKNGWRQLDAFHLEYYGDQFKPYAQQPQFDVYVPVIKA
ncbi:HTH domain-containing protein [Bacillus sp. M6-12]|uniref:HTH domain-containing protein n=1 Tax=Bacillus sp. M6-12 TaxID=2054166 RepID=UPI001157B7BB|nr:HTH domain-containing protein [Bacillus sp. M6-12]